VIISISGVAIDAYGNRGTAGVGKDTIADHLVEQHLSAKVAMADPLKRVCRDVYDFSSDQLWGPSEFRNRPDTRYPRPQHEWVGYPGKNEKHCSCCGAVSPAVERGIDVTDGSTCYLTPRYALQLLGTEWGRHCFPDTWAAAALRTAKVVIEYGLHYDCRTGLSSTPRPMGYSFVAIPDVRFINEMKAVRAAGGKVIRVVRRIEGTIRNATHRSETELFDLPDSEFDYVIENNSSTSALALKTDRMIDVFSGRIMPYQEGCEDTPPFKRG
jgi:hypothetical protein